MCVWRQLNGKPALNGSESVAQLRIGSVPRERVLLEVQDPIRETASHCNNSCDNTVRRSLCPNRCPHRQCSQWQRYIWLWLRSRERYRIQLWQITVWFQCNQSLSHTGMCQSRSVSSLCSSPLWSDLTSDFETTFDSSSGTVWALTCASRTWLGGNACLQSLTMPSQCVHWLSIILQMFGSKVKICSKWLNNWSKLQIKSELLANFDWFRFIAFFNPYKCSVGSQVPQLLQFRSWFQFYFIWLINCDQQWHKKVDSNIDSVICLRISYTEKHMNGIESKIIPNIFRQLFSSVNQTISVRQLRPISASESQFWDSVPSQESTKYSQKNNWKTKETLVKWESHCWQFC